MFLGRSASRSGDLIPGPTAISLQRSHGPHAAAATSRTSQRATEALIAGLEPTPKPSTNHLFAKRGQAGIALDSTHVNFD